MISVELRNLFRTVYFFGEKEKLNLEEFSRDEAIALLDVFLKASGTGAEVHWINTTGLYAQGYIVNPYEETLYFALRNKNVILSFKHAHSKDKAQELAQSLELDSQLDTEDVERFLHREAPWEVVVDINLYLNISKVYKKGLDDEDMSAAFEEFVHQEFGDDSPVGLFFRFIRE